MLLSLSVLSRLYVKRFDKISGVPFGTQVHSTKSDEKDVVRVTEVVLKQKLFVITQGRKHHAYPKIHTNPLWSWKHGKTKEWIETKKKQFIKYKGAVREENDSDPETADIET